MASSKTTTRKNARGQGRKPKPEAAKRLSGSRHQNKDAPELPTVENIDCPGWLAEHYPLAQQMWETVCPSLCKAGILSVEDAHNLEAFCVEYARWREAVTHYKAKGPVVTGATGGPVKNPAGTVINETLRNISRFGSELGLSPSARSALIDPGKQKTANKFNEFK